MSCESASGPMWIATSMPSPRRSIDRFPNRSETSISGYRSRNRGRTKPSTWTPKPRPALTRSKPRGADAKPPTRSTASPMLARMSTQRALSSAPASVRTTSRVVRCNSGFPTPSLIARHCGLHSIWAVQARAPLPRSSAELRHLENTQIVQVQHLSIVPPQEQCVQHAHRSR
jgi:hypothetical protein